MYISTSTTSFLLSACFGRLVAILGQVSYKTSKRSIWFSFHIFLKFIIIVAMLWWYMAKNNLMVKCSPDKTKHHTCT